MKQKKLMLLGGIRYLLPVIKAAHEQGYYVITADYIPNNIAHKYSDEYVNISIIDKDAVLKVAQEKEVDGVMSFGVDPGVVAASYVQNKLNLPSFGPFESVEILQNKDKFRRFLKEHGFNTPWAYSFASMGEAMSKKELLTFPLIVKPTDSAGSKGVTRVDKMDDLEAALVLAFRHSIKKRVIIEQFIEKQGCSSDSDCFSVDGELKLVTFSAQRFDENATGIYVPAAYSWPSTMSVSQKQELQTELQRLLTLLRMKTSVYNIETRIGIDGKTYIMEVSPRGGGNRLSEMIRYATGIDLITAAVRASVGDSIPQFPRVYYQGYWAEIVLHADKEGLFCGIDVADSLQAEIVEKDLWVTPGDKVKVFDGANNAIGMLILRFSSSEDLENALVDQKEWLKVIVDNE